ncbi:MAG: DEAD/DEAH box helicase [Succinivibrio sp.]
MTFEEFDLPDFLLENIRKKGWENPTEVQEQVLPAALSGRDVLGGAPTGTGKSGAFLVPIIKRLAERPGAGVRALVVEPSRELALQVASEASDLCAGTAIECGTIIGGAGREGQLEKERAITVATPGRLLEFLRKGSISLDEVEVLVIDEADRMLDMGFRDDVAAIAQACTSRSQAMLFSATLEGAGIARFASEVLDDPEEVRVGSGDGDRLPEDLKLRAYYTAGDEQKCRVLVQLLTTSRARSVVFVKTRDRVGMVRALLRRSGFEVATLEGDMSQNERDAASKRFREGQCDILVATDIAARGLDMPDVKVVYNFDLAQNAAVLTHRSGRTARAGSRGVSVLFVLPEQIQLLEGISRYTGREIEKRHIKGVCAEFPKEGSQPGHSDKKRSRASDAGNGGFDKRQKDEEKKKPRDKKRYRVVKNKGKPDFAQKRRRKAELEERRAQAAAERAREREGGKSGNGEGNSEP